MYYSINASSVIFGANAGPFNSVSDAMECIEFEAVNDDIKEAEETFILVLNSTDPGVCLCRDAAPVIIEEDPNDGEDFIVGNSMHFDSNFFSIKR